MVTNTNTNIKLIIYKSCEAVAHTFISVAEEILLHESR